MYEETMYEKIIDIDMKEKIYSNTLHNYQRNLG